MGVGYVDLSKYFNRTARRPDMRVLLNPETGDLIKQQQLSSTFGVGGGLWKQADDFDPGSFMGSSFARHYGLDPKVFRGGSFENVQKNVERAYGMNLVDYLSAGPDRRQQAFNKTNNVYKADGTRRKDPGPLIDPDTGLPSRPPETPEEAMYMQWKAFEANREQNLGLMKNAIATLRYGLGGVTRGGPFSSAAMQSPLLGQMANTYMNTQFEAPDLSYFLRPDVPGYGQSNQFGGGGPKPIPTTPGIGRNLSGGYQRYLGGNISPAMG